MALAATAPTASPPCAQLPFERNSDDFDFDTQIIVQLLEAGKRIVEIPIPTYYGDEICYVNGMKYARTSPRRPRATGPTRWASAPARSRSPATPTSSRRATDSSHGRILRVAGAASRPRGSSTSGAPTARSPSGCRAHGPPRHRRRPRGAHAACASGSTGSSQADLDDGIPAEVGDDFDVVLARRRARARARPGALLARSRGPCSAGAARSSPACRTSGTGTRGRGWRSGGSTTTGAASSTATTCASSPGAASSGSRRAGASASGAVSTSGCRSTSPAGAGA